MNKRHTVGLILMAMIAAFAGAVAQSSDSMWRAALANCGPDHVRDINWQEISEEGANVVSHWAPRQLEDRKMTFDFSVLMTKVSEGWSRQDTDLALSAFTDDAIYTEPPNRQVYIGQDQLRYFFDAVRPGSTMIWHNLWFDEASGIGAGEYSFHNGGRETAAHGVTVVVIEDQKISVWREYQQRGPIKFGDFHQVEGKNWEWTIEDFEDR